ncbi:hypothetical protein BOTBODRAFT_180165 [Botryobasidium botryosum FD-172 SS1]|uniref:Uncharacterized protein n=1 Tax=Botryobasidium botryosum (strain FD-172 SS1) TaxID=930990 RepID=A0A067LY24_BOTB1|nr:hypothetical protein BOTBODRAFT_180165 [Botryobasidium botryosum FD-172 SS1]
MPPLCLLCEAPRLARLSIALCLPSFCLSHVWPSPWGSCLPALLTFPARPCHPRASSQPRSSCPAAHFTPPLPVSRSPTGLPSPAPYLGSTVLLAPHPPHIPMTVSPTRHAAHTYLNPFLLPVPHFKSPHSTSAQRGHVNVPIAPPASSVLRAFVLSSLSCPRLPHHHRRLAPAIPHAQRKHV